MPTYEYACAVCGHEFEHEQRISEPAIKKCPKCGKPKVRRMITQGNFILKGSGWYADGYGGSSKKADADTTSAETKTESTDSSSKDSSTPDAKESTTPKKEKKKKDKTS